MKKLLSALLSMSIVFGGVGGYSASAIEPVPEDYLGHDEYIYLEGYIVETNENFNIEQLNLNVGSIDECSANAYNVELTQEIEVGYDTHHRAYFNDELFGGYKLVNETTGMYIIKNSTFEDLDLINNIGVEEIYKVYIINRNGLFKFEDGTVVSNELGGGYGKIYNINELVENDVNDDGNVNSNDALELLNVIVGNKTLTVKQKIQSGVTYCRNYVDYEEFSSYYINASKALEILQQVVE